MGSTINTIIFFVGLVMFFSMITGRGVFDKSMYSEEGLTTGNIVTFFRMTLNPNVWTPAALLTKFIIGTIVTLFVLALVRGFNEG